MTVMDAVFEILAPLWPDVLAAWEHWQANA